MTKRTRLPKEQDASYEKRAQKKDRESRAEKIKREAREAAIRRKKRTRKRSIVETTNPEQEPEI